MINTISVYQKFHTWLIVLKIVSILKMIYMKREKSVFKVKYFENILDRSEFSIINKTNNNYLQLKLI
ncbi:hypothetical protein CPARA_1gp048 (nucleomorph) [Cryptomonas paramecium]|uniref:Uncharacterized protein n=1 Tax=Cryptomonas paramaecium TaxID=2898 RepID=F2HHB0_9CRYP|nr:hypothetical protein CPARA_1gp048 [Cryptomonas paramecium]AEA38706.1 hypothetical protein CPARA_1gp048 [Cryptomonas paramecium]